MTSRDLPQPNIFQRRKRSFEYRARIIGHQWVFSVYYRMVRGANTQVAD